MCVPAASEDSGLLGDLDRVRPAGHRVSGWAAVVRVGQARRKDPRGWFWWVLGGRWSLAGLWSEGPQNLGVTEQREKQNPLKKKKKKENPRLPIMSPHSIQIFVTAQG